jgi:hypothetical protein
MQGPGDEIQVETSKFNAKHVQQMGESKRDESQRPHSDHKHHDHRQHDDLPPISCADSMANDSSDDCSDLACFALILLIGPAIGWALIVTTGVVIAFPCGPGARDTYGYRGSTCLLKRLTSCITKQTTEKPAIECKYRSYNIDCCRMCCRND